MRNKVYYPEWCGCICVSSVEIRCHCHCQCLGLIIIINEIYYILCHIGPTSGITTSCEIIHIRVYKSHSSDMSVLSYICLAHAETDYKCIQTIIHWGLMAPCGDIDLGQHWFRQWLVPWRHQAITRHKVNWSSNVFFSLNWELFHKHNSRH